VRHDKARPSGVDKVAVDAVAEGDGGHKPRDGVSSQQADGGVLLPDAVAVADALDDDRVAGARVPVDGRLLAREELALEVELAVVVRPQVDEPPGRRRNPGQLPQPGHHFILVG
jgi:hypothetical protein